MSETRTRRGRPKGSGIDDRQRLDAIARLIAINPALKPTTAIRSIGVTDPSVIRRLRDKFNAVRVELMQDLADAKSTTARTANMKTVKTTPVSVVASACGLSPANDCTRGANATKAPRARSIAAAAAPHARISAAAEPKAVANAMLPPAPRSASRDTTARNKPRITATNDDTERLPARAALSAEGAELFTTFFSAGVMATNTLMAAHTTLANELIRSPYVSLALRQQLAFSEWAAGLVPTFYFPPKTAT